jgi:purine nucleosidase
MAGVNPHPHRARVIVNTDAKNEADDQYAIVHALLTPSFEIEGVIAAHFGTRKSGTSMLDSRAEVDLLLDLMAWQGRVRVENGAPYALPDDRTPVPSPGANLIIESALKEGDDRPLHIAFYGPLTDMASALLMEPRIQEPERNVRVVWIGGGPYPGGGPEFNLSNDITAANVVFRSKLEVWQIPWPVYRRMPVSYAELEDKVAPCGPLGRYLVDQLVEYNATHASAPMEYRSLGDSPAVGVIMYPGCGDWSMRPAPEFTDDMHYVHRGRNRDIRVYETIDARFVHEDFFAKLRRFTRDTPGMPNR